MAPNPLSGVASWYGRSEQGKTTASGEIFNRYAMTCAHRTLPLGSTIRVTNVENNERVVARVNDRGPYAYGRVIDCSERIATLLHYRGGQDMAPVQIEVLHVGPTKEWITPLGAVHDQPIEVAEAIDEKTPVVKARAVAIRRTPRHTVPLVRRRYRH